MSKAEAVGRLLTELARDPGAAWLLWTDVQVSRLYRDETSRATTSAVQQQHHLLLLCATHCAACVA